MVQGALFTTAIGQVFAFVAILVEFITKFDLVRLAHSSLHSAPALAHAALSSLPLRSWNAQLCQGLSKTQSTDSSSFNLSNLLIIKLAQPGAALDAAFRARLVRQHKMHVLLSVNQPLPFDMLDSLLALLQSSLADGPATALP